MLLSEEPAKLINQTINNFNIEPDRIAIARINESLATLNQARDLRAKECEQALRRLSRQLNTLQSQHEELSSTHSPTTHASSIARLDTQKFRTAKAASDAEMETERLAQQAADLAARLQELELQGVDGGDLDAEGKPRESDLVDDEVLLRLKVYRSLGIELERDGKEGEYTKAVVRNEGKGDVHVVNLDKKFSRFFYANYFWSVM